MVISEKARIFKQKVPEEGFTEAKVCRVFFIDLALSRMLTPVMGKTELSHMLDCWVLYESNNVQVSL
jgi:hypothetical protein